MSMLNGLAKRIVAKGMLTESDALKHLESANQQKLSFVRYMVQEKILPAKDLAYLNSQSFGIPYLDISAFDLNQLPKVSVKSAAINEGMALPLFKRGNHLFIAISDPSNLQVLDDIKFQTGQTPEPIIVEDDKLFKVIEDKIGQDNFSVFNDVDAAALENLDISNDLQAFDDNVVSGADDTPIVRFVNKVLLDAINSNASDIHFEPYERVYRIRFRQDGLLNEYATPPINISNRVSTRIKVMSQLDISERRVPQDGRFKMRLTKSRAIDFRVSTCPTQFGEKVVMRILDPTSASMGIDALGYNAMQKELFLNNIKKPQGMVLVTGPTGSGKTVSLYTALNILNTIDRNISAAEDPIEINLPGVNQVNVNIKAGLTFAVALRAFLRQDPDVVMVGEIRDIETAEIAVKAAQTGHLVLSTVHTNSAAETVTRLLNMGVPAFNLATSISLIIAQRLARKLCNKCKAKIEVPEHALLEIGFTQAEIDAGNLVIYTAKGCSYCVRGYKGRIGLYEVMEVSKEISQLIMQGKNAFEIEAQAHQEGVLSLRQAGLEKIKNGITTIEEVSRVTKE